jgi:hypothetical protein
VANRGCGLARTLLQCGAVVVDDDAGALGQALSNAFVSTAGGETGLKWARQHGVESWLDSHEAIFASVGGSGQ